MQNGGGIDPATKPYAEGYVGKQMFLDGVGEKGIKLILGVLQREIMNLAKRKRPIGFGGDFAVAPLHPISWGKFANTVDHGPGARNEIQREIAIEGFPAEFALDFRMDEYGFEFRAEV